MKQREGLLALVLCPLLVSVAVGQRPISAQADDLPTVGSQQQEFLHSLVNAEAKCLTTDDGRSRRVITIRDGVSLFNSPDSLPSRVDIAAAFDIWFLYSEANLDGWVQLGDHASCDRSERVWGQVANFVELAADNRMLLWSPFPDNEQQSGTVRIYDEPQREADASSFHEVTLFASHLGGRVLPILATIESGWYEVVALPQESGQRAVRGWLRPDTVAGGQFREMLYIRRFELLAALARLMGAANGASPGQLDRFIQIRDELLGCPQPSPAAVAKRRSEYELERRKNKKRLYALSSDWMEQGVDRSKKGWFQNGQFYWIPVDQLP